MIDQHAAVSHARENADVPETNTSHVIVVADAHEYEVCPLGRLGRRRKRRAGVLAYPLVGLGCSSVVHLNRVACGGLDANAVVEVISKGAAQSWQMENRADTMAKGEFEFGFAVDWMRKDLDITLRTGRTFQARLPLTALVDQFYADVQAKGGSRWDTSSLITRLSD